MHWHCGTNNRAPRWTFTDPCKPEVRPGAREESASPAWLAAPANPPPIRLYTNLWPIYWTRPFTQLWEVLLNICDGFGMLTGYAFSSGHLVPSHLGLAYAQDQSNLSLFFRTMLFEQHLVLSRFCFENRRAQWCSIVGATVTVHQFFCILRNEIKKMFYSCNCHLDMFWIKKLTKWGWLMQHVFQKCFRKMVNFILKGSLETDSNDRPCPCFLNL